MPPARAAIKTHQIDGYIGALETGYAFEEAKEWRVITTAAPFVDHFITHVLFARDELIEKHPETVRAFLKGWFETIAFMKANKEKSVEISAKVIDVSPAVAARVYDEQIGFFSTDGTFDPQAVAVAQEVLHRNGAAQGNSRRQGPVHDAVRAGKGRHVTANTTFSIKSSEAPSPAKAGDPVIATARVRVHRLWLLDAPPSRGMTCQTHAAPQTSRAVSTISLSFAISSSTVMVLPPMPLEKPHCGDSASCSSGT